MIISNGCETSAGFIGELQPTSTIKAAIGRPKENCTNKSLNREIICGDELVYNVNQLDIEATMD